MHTGNHKHGLQRCRGHAAAVARAAVWAAMGLATAYFGRAQQTATSTPLPVTVAPITGGTLHGVIKDGAVPLPGVTVTATNTLTGKRYATTSDITGAWSMRIPSNGRYVLRTEFTAFAASTHEVLLNAASHERAVDFDLQLASRVAQLERAQQAQAGNADASQIAVTVQAEPLPAGASVKLSIAASDLGLNESAGRWCDKLDIFFIQRDDAGLEAQIEGQTLGLRLKSSTYQNLLRDGLPFEHFVQFKRAAATLRVLVVDENTGRMGSVTIPGSALTGAD